MEQGGGSVSGWSKMVEQGLVELEHSLVEHQFEEERRQEKDNCDHGVLSCHTIFYGLLPHHDLRRTMQCMVLQDREDVSGKNSSSTRSCSTRSCRSTIHQRPQ